MIYFQVGEKGLFGQVLLVAIVCFPGTSHRTLIYEPRLKFHSCDPCVNFLASTEKTAALKKIGVFRRTLYSAGCLRKRYAHKLHF